jgi:translation initiation factor IF-1
MTLRRAKYPTEPNNVEMDGDILEALARRGRYGKYLVKLDEGREIVAFSKRPWFQKDPLPGDRVKVVMSVYDLSRGRIVERYP